KAPVAPYQSRYVATSRTGALLVALKTESGLVGWGEAPQVMVFHNPTPYTGKEAGDFREKLIGRDATAIESLYADGLFADPYIQSAVEMACWDLLGKLCGQPLYRLLGGMVRERVAVACCMGIQTPEKAAEVARGYLDLGFGALT